MARKKKKGEAVKTAWLITYADVMTLLLTFFVLLLSMSSMDTPLLARITVTRDDISPIAHAGRGRVPDKIQLLLEMVQDPAAITDNRDRIKDLLFPNEILPKELTPGTLEENLRILAHPEGVVIVLNEGVLFDPGAYALTPSGKGLLHGLVPFLHYTAADVNIAGHTDDTEEATGMDKHELSGRRALSVLEFFLQEKFPASRFSVSGYGPDKPLEPNTSEKNRKANRRVEILVKTSQWLGRYL